MKGSERHIRRVPFKRRDECFRSVVEDLDCPVVARRQKIRLITMRVIINPIHTLGLMRLQREIRLATPQIPHPDRAIKTRGSERIRILGIKRHTHDIMRMPLKHPHTLPTILKIPQLDRHVVARGQDIG